MPRGHRRWGLVKGRAGTPRPSPLLLAVSSGLFAASLLVSLIGLFHR